MKSGSGGTTNGQVLPQLRGSVSLPLSLSGRKRKAFADGRSGGVLHTLLVITSTALVTWIVATFVHSQYRVNELYGSKSDASMMGLHRTRREWKAGHVSSDKATVPSIVTEGGFQSSMGSKVNGNVNVDTTPPKKSKKPKKTFFVNHTSYDGPSRVFPVYPYDFPCFEGEEDLQVLTPASQGILFQRPVKAGTTTLAGIVMRLAHTRAKDKPFGKCKHRSNHGTALEFGYPVRNKKESFLFSVLRDPTAKAISRFFHFDVSIGQKDPTDEYFQMIMKRPYNAHAHVTDLMMKPTSPYMAGLDWNKFAQETLDEYDFIAITERMDESLVVLQMLLKLELRDILYVRARSSGTFSNGSSKRPCVYLVPSFLTPGMEQFFSSPEWYKQIEGDLVLYQAAYKSLDRTIDALGRDKVQAQVEKLKKAQDYVQIHCAPKVVSICDGAGKYYDHDKNTCYKWGEGCDHECVDNLDLPAELL